MLRAENATTRTCGIFYKTTMMAVLLFGSETWNLAPLSLKHLKRFHIRAAWHMAGTGPQRNPNGSWTYPDTDAVMKAVGLCSISQYVEVCRQHILNFIVSTYFQCMLGRSEETWLQSSPVLVGPVVVIEG